MDNEQQEVVQQEVQKAKGWIPYLVSLLVSLGVVGGGGTLGVNVIQNDLGHTNESLTKIEAVVNEVQKNVQTNVKELREQVAEIAPVTGQVDRLREQVTKLDDELREQVGKIDDKLDQFAPREWVVKLQEKVNSLSEKIARLEVEIEKLKP